MKLDGKRMIELIKLCKNKVQVYRFVRMPQLQPSTLTLNTYHNDKRLISL